MPVPQHTVLVSGPAFAPAPAQAAAGNVPQHTVLVSGPAHGPPPAAAAPPPGPAPGAGAPSLQRTMLGIAAPGIAPNQNAAPAGPARTVLMNAPGAPAPTAAAPGAAEPPRPRHALTLPLDVQYVPPPEPLHELPVPAPPRIVRKGGFPLATVALILIGLLVAGGAVIALLWKGTPPITGQPRATPDGKDVLHLVCDAKSCKDGTVVTLAGVKTTFASGEADLPLATPLHVGDNKLELMVDRPGMGRDELVKLVVPVAFRVSADVSTMSGPKPSITIRVQAQPGADVRVDDKPLALDANGAGAYTIDESVPTQGAADVSRVVSVDVPYVIVLPPTKASPSPVPQKGTVSARVAVAPLRVDAPGERGVVEEDKVLVAGRAAKGSTVTVDGASVTVAPDGGFETFVPLPAQGERTVDVRGGTAELVPRTVHVSVTRVASLAEAATAFEQQKPIGYDAAMSDLVGKTGSPIVVDGTVLESRAAGHRTYVLVDDRRGCASSPCLARVIVGRDLPLVRGDALRAYGIVARAFAASTGQTVPEIESSFVVRTRR
jgi:hypothetical protein